MAEKVCECIDEYKARRKQRNGKRRHYTIQDLNRISLYVNRDEKMKPLEIIAELAYFHGYGMLFCGSARAIDKANNLFRLFQSIFTTIAGSKLLSMLVAILRGMPVLVGGWLKAIGAVAILSYVFSNKALALIENILQDDTISRVNEINKEACQYLRKKYGDSNYGDTSYELDLSDEISQLNLLDSLSVDDFLLSESGDMKL